MYADHLEGDGARLFEDAARLGFEGIISKRADAPYRSDRREAWVKVKCVQRAKFSVVGFVKDPTGVAALHFGRTQGGIGYSAASGELLGRSEGTRDCARHLAAGFGFFDGASSDLVKAHNAISISTDHFCRILLKNSAVEAEGDR